MNFQQSTVLVLQRNEIREFQWSVPRWDDIMTTDARQGIVRHGGLPNAVNHIGKDLKPEYGVHVRAFLENVRKPTGLVLAFGFRNSGPNNLGLPGYDRRREPCLFARRDEPWESWTYFAFVMFQDGSFELHRIKLVGQDGQDILLLDAPERSGDVVWAITGQPLTWDGLVPAHSTIAALTYDQRHSWHLSWESHEQAKWPECRHHLVAHSALMEAFMTRLHDPLKVRAAALAQIAAEHNLSIEDAYLHSTLGIRENGDLVLLIQRGSLAQLGYSQMALGAQRTILLDNGGSTGIGVWTPEKLQRGKFDEATYVGNATYFRPNAHSLAVIELALDSLESKAFGARYEDRHLLELQGAR